MFTISFVTDDTFERVAHMSTPDRDIAKKALEALCSQNGSSVPGGLLWEGSWGAPDSKAVEIYSPILGWRPH